ncbi:MAG: hypothetical protein JXB24_01530 [Bacteroidales bacterium]|nr:hypothetical protein [Bacteroidales bacterium]
MNKYKTLIWVFVMCIALGMLESAVVIYLREIYYPEGFAFPLKIMHEKVIFTEFIRELATLVILFSIALISGKNFIQRFAFFIFSFGTWDIFYYIFLKLLINWPDSFMTWDVLFLIPVTWIGPVLCPIVVSLTMIFFAIAIIRRNETNYQVCVSKYSWWFIIIGSILIYLSFTWEYSSYLITSMGLKNLLYNTDPVKLNELVGNFIPGKFNWILFIAGEFIIIAGISLILTTKSRQK